MLRRVVDYFCHLAVKPDFYPQMVKDRDFENTEFAAKIRWLAKDNEDIYDPDYVICFGLLLCTALIEADSLIL